MTLPNTRRVWHVRWAHVGLAAVLVGAGCGVGEPDDRGVPTGQLGGLDGVFEAFGHDTPGCAVGVGRNGEPVLEAAYGLADLAAETEIDTDTTFDIASVSKQMTAGLVMLAVAQDLVALDDEVGDWVNGLPPAIAAVTLGDLVHHVSGVGDYADVLFDRGVGLDEVTTNGDVVAALTDVPDLAFEPGSRFDYSNTGYVLLALTVEAAMGDSLANIADRHLFRPLGMDDTVIRDGPAAVVERRATGYDAAAADAEVDESSWFQTGDGAVHATAGDLVRWSRAWVGPALPEPGVGSESWRRAMLAAGPVADVDGSEYAGGVVLDDIDGSPVVVHDGAWSGFSSSLLVRLDDGIAVAVLCNVDDLDAGALVESVVDAWDSGDLSASRD